VHINLYKFPYSSSESMFSLVVYEPKVRLSICGRQHIAPLEEHCHNSKFGIFELLVYKETLADCTFNRYSVITQFAKLAAGEQLCRRCTHRNYSTSKPLKVSPKKSQILSCDTVLLGVRYVSCSFVLVPTRICSAAL